VSDVDSLCGDLEMLIIALYQHLAPGSTSEQAGSHMKPGSRPTLSVHVHDLLAEIAAGIVDHEHRSRRLLGDVSRANSVGEALHALPHLATRLPQLRLELLVRDLDSWARDCRSTLGLNRRLQMLGPCPVVQTQSLAVGYDVDGNPGAELDSAECMAFDLRETRKATREARQADAHDTRMIEVYSRAHLLADLDADRKSKSGDVWCPGCGARWPSSDWPRLALMLGDDREAVADAS
jgi:hypothetical protein